MPPKPTRIAGQPVTAGDIASSNSHLDAVFGNRRKAWMHKASGNSTDNPPTISAAGVIASDIRSSPLKRHRGRPCKHPLPEPAPAASKEKPVVPLPGTSIISYHPTSNASLLSPALTNEPSPADSNRNVTPQINTPSSEAPANGDNPSNPTHEPDESIRIPHTSTIRTSAIASTEAEHAGTENQQTGALNLGSHLHVHGPSLAVRTEASQSRGSKRHREPSGEKEEDDDECLVAPPTKRTRVNLTEVTLSSDPSYIRTLEGYGSTLQEHIKKGGGWISLPDHDTHRFRFLNEACTKRDGFFLVLHQLFCIWTSNSNTAYLLMSPINASKSAQAFGILQQILRRNEDLKPAHLKLFSDFPERLDVQKGLESSFYKFHLPQVRHFMERLAEKWNTILNIVEKRSFPFLAHELMNTFGCWSEVMRYTLFMTSLRKLGIKAQHAAQVNSLWAMDQDLECKALRDGKTAASLNARRLELRTRYQTATAEARRAANLMDEIPGSGIPTAASTPLAADSRYTLRAAPAFTAEMPVNESAMEQQGLSLMEHQRSSPTVAEQATPMALELNEGAPSEGVQQLAVSLEQENMDALATMRRQQDQTAPQDSAQNSAHTSDTGSGVSDRRQEISMAPLDGNEVRPQQRTLTQAFQASEALPMRIYQQAPDAQSPTSRRDVSLSALPGGRPDEVRPTQPQHKSSFQNLEPRAPQLLPRSQHLTSSAAANTFPFRVLAHPHQLINQNSPNVRTTQSGQFQGSFSPINQGSPTLRSAQPTQYQAQIRQYGSASQAPPNMAYAQVPQHLRPPLRGQAASPDFAVQHPQGTHQGYQTPQSMRQSYQNHQGNHPIYQNPQSMQQGYQSPHFSNQLHGHNTQLRRVSGQDYSMPSDQTQQAGQGQQYGFHPGAQGHQQQYMISTQGSQQQQIPRMYQLGSSVVPQQTMAGAHGHRPPLQHLGVRAPDLFQLSETDAPFGPHDWTSAHLAAHLPHLRSPLRRPTKGTFGRHFQFIDRLITSQRIIPGSGIRNFSFELSEAQMSFFLRQRWDSLGSHVQPYCHGAKRLRLRFCQIPEEAPRSDSTWVTHATAWPSEIYVSFNDQYLQPPRKLHFKYDLPIELTQYLVQGNNELKITMPAKVSVKQGAFFFAVELVTVSNRAEIIAGITTGATRKTIDASKTRDEIVRRLSAGHDEDIQAEDSAGLIISVADPWASTMFETPVRGLSCKHLECFDLETMLDTRKGKSTEDRSINEPSKVDDWKCPICDQDIRPCNLGVDLFMVEVRRDLIAAGKGNTKAITAKIDGSWEAVEVESDDEDEDENPAGGAHPSRAPTTAGDIIVIDDD